MKWIYGFYGLGFSSSVGYGKNHRRYQVRLTQPDRTVWWPPSTSQPGPEPTPKCFLSSGHWILQFNSLTHAQLTFTRSDLRMTTTSARTTSNGFSTIKSVSCFTCIYISTAHACQLRLTTGKHSLVASIITWKASVIGCLIRNWFSCHTKHGMWMKLLNDPVNWSTD